MPREDSEYRRLLREARERGITVGRASVERLMLAFEHAVTELSGLEGRGRMLDRAAARDLKREIITIIMQLDRDLVKVVDGGTRLTIRQVTEAHRRALGELEGHYGLGNRLTTRLSGAETRAFTTLLARQGNARSFKTLVRRHIVSLAPDMDKMIDSAVLRGVSSGKLTKDLARLMGGNNPELIRRLPTLRQLHSGPASTLDLSAYGLSTSDTRNLRSLISDSRRIAITETNNALREANLQSMKDSNIITGARWTLSGNHPVPDECDDMAEADNGMGPGLYRLGDWPLAPHPHCGCTQTDTQFKPPSQWAQED